MPFADERADIATMVRSVISAWIVFLAMFFGSVLYSTIDSALSDPARPPAAGNQVVAAEDLRADRTDAPRIAVQKNPAVSGATE